VILITSQCVEKGAKRQLDLGPFTTQQQQASIAGESESVDASSNKGTIQESLEEESRQDLQEEDVLESAVEAASQPEIKPVEVKQISMRLLKKLRKGQKKHLLLLSLQQYLQRSSSCHLRTLSLLHHLRLVQCPECMSQLPRLNSLGTWREMLSVVRLLTFRNHQTFLHLLSVVRSMTHKLGFKN
jgi:hypothetical protein